MIRIFSLLMLFAALPASARQPAWHLFAHDDGCVDPALLMKAEKLPRAPASPEDFARMLRERGEQVVVGPPDGLPPELAGMVVQVKVGEWKAPIFVRDEVCRNLDKGSRQPLAGCGFALAGAEAGASVGQFAWYSRYGRHAVSQPFNP